VAPLPSGVNRYRVGDVLEYQEAWQAPNHFSGRVRYEVQRATDDRVEVEASYLRPDNRVAVTRHQVWDQLGNLLTYNDGSLRTMPWVQVPAELSPGKRWLSEFWVIPQEGSSLKRQRITWDLRVTGQEALPGPAGKPVLAFKVEGTSRTSVQAPGGTTYWVDPGTFIKLRENTWRKDAQGQTVLEYTRELRSLRRGPEPAP